MKSSTVALLLVACIVVISTRCDAGKPGTHAVPSTCKKTIDGCPDQSAETECNTCCRGAGCNRGDCKKNKKTNKKWKCLCDC